MLARFLCVISMACVLLSGVPSHLARADGPDGNTSMVSEVSGSRGLDALSERGTAPPRVATVGPRRWTSLGPTTVLDGEIGLTERMREVTGRVTAIRVQPGQNRNIWLVGTATGGIWRTTDGGKTWAPSILPSADGRFDPLSLAIGAIAFAPGGCVVYAGTGDVAGGILSYSGTGLLISDDRGVPGQTWRRLTANLVSSTRPYKSKPFRWHGIRVAAMITTGSLCTDGLAGPHEVWIATLPAPPTFFSPVSSSTDHAQFLGLFRATVVPGVDTLNFTRAFDGLFSDLKVDDAGSVYAARISDGKLRGGVYRCCDWQLLQEFEDRFTRVAKIAIADPNTVYASLVTNDGAVELFRGYKASCFPCRWPEVPFEPALPIPDIGSRKPGYCNWDPSRPNPSAEAPCYFSNVLSTHPKNPDTLYAGGVALWKCSNCTPHPSDGKRLRWTDISYITPRPSEVIRPFEIGFLYIKPTHYASPRNGIHVDQQAMDWSGNRLIVGNDGGVWSTDDEGATWQNHNFGGLAIAQLYRGALDPRRPDVVFAGTQDLGTIRRDGWRWRSVQGGDGVGVIVSHRDPATHWATVYQSVVDGVQGLAISRTRNAGLTYQRADLGLPMDKRMRRTPPFVQCPDRRVDLLLFGYRSVWKVHDFFKIPTTRAFETASPPAWQVSYLADPKASDVTSQITAIAFPENEDAGCSTYAFSDAGGVIRLVHEDRLLSSISLGEGHTINALAFEARQPMALFVAASTTTGGGLICRWEVSKNRCDDRTPTGWYDELRRYKTLDHPFRALATLPDKSNRGGARDLVFAGSDFGVWVSIPNIDLRWCHLSVNRSTPYPPIMDLKIHRLTDAVYAFTFGRGVFRLKDVDAVTSDCLKSIAQMP